MQTANSLTNQRVAEAPVAEKQAQRELSAARMIPFLATVQFILLAAHASIYYTWVWFQKSLSPRMEAGLEIGVGVLCFSFLASSLLAFRYNNLFVRAFYRIAAVWLGAVNFFFLAAVLCWLVYGGVRAAGINVSSVSIADALYGVAILVSLWGVLNGSWVRVKRITVKLENLPDSWRGRTALLVSDLHLGHVRGLGFMRRMAATIASLKPDVLFIAGDLFDGTKVNAERLASAWKVLNPALGSYFVAGNHEQFREDIQYLRAVDRAGIRVLQNEKLEVDGLQIAGVPYNHATHAEHFRSVLKSLNLDRSRASILLTHAPDHPAVAAEAGIGLQLSGHTHLGQVFPFTWFTKRIYKQFTYGLSRIGNLQVYTSSGAGSWGPPLRVGSTSEIVLIRFDRA